MLPSLSYDEEADYPGCPNRPSDGDDGDVDGDIDQIKSWLLLAIKMKSHFFCNCSLFFHPTVVDNSIMPNFFFALCF